MIHDISISQLRPHPDNPRLDLGDLTELAESIRAKGVLQNLTVTPAEGDNGEYTVIIGHRRLAAAQLAGLTDVPCTIVYMTRQEEIATMLLENIQRSDLTVYEQAQGFQMMLDLGDSVSGISEKTGFSETTVRRRVKLLELDSEKFKASAERGATLEDYAKLDQIEDIKTKNKVLDSIGTNNFDYEVRNAVDKEQRKKNEIAWREFFESFATEVDSTIGYAHVLYAWFNRGVDMEIPDDADTVRYFFHIPKNSHRVGYLLREMNSEQTEEDKAREEQRKRDEEMKARETEVTAQAFELRYAFAEAYAGLKKHVPVLIEFAVRSRLKEGWRSLDTNRLFEFLLPVADNADDDEGEEDVPRVYELLKDIPLERQLFAVAYLALSDDKNEGYFGYRHDRIANPRLDLIYEMFERLGYQISDAEKALRCGTHELFARPEDEQESEE